MSNSELSKTWQQEVEWLDTVPPEMALDKTAAWGKLYPRLENRPARKVLVVFRWAAVFILLGSLILYYFISNTSKSPNITIVKDKENNKEGTIFKSPAAEPLVSTKKTVTSTKITSALTKNTAELKPPAVPEKGAVIVAVANDIQLEKFELSPINIPVEDSFRTISIITPVEKKKLRVIHINDYSLPVKPSSMMVNAENRYKNLVRFHNLSSGEPENLNSNASPSSPLLKIKITPQN